MKNPKRTFAESQALEAAARERIKAGKAGKLIQIRLWTEDPDNNGGSSCSTAATSITSAVKFLRESSKYYANWSMEFISEEGVLGGP